MKLLVVNCGSSSLKYQLLDMEKEEVLAKGNYERIGEKESFLTHKPGNEKLVIQKAALNHAEALAEIINQLQDEKNRVIDELEEIEAVGHRVVHGGEYFGESVLIDEDVTRKIDDCSKLAPLHNPAAVQGIKACNKILPHAKMVAVFDTAFHQTMPKESYLYPIPYEYYEKYQVRKYGMHGTSHKYVAYKLAELAGISLEGTKIVTCHLGQGASLCAIQNGKSMDTSMGLTPLGGIPMVTRSGDLDPSVVTFIMEKENIEPNDMTNILNKKSGLAAIAKEVPDYREIEAASYHNEQAKVAANKFTISIAEYIARYAAKMKGLDYIIFTGGIGENQGDVRQRICDHFAFMGLEIDSNINQGPASEREISTKDSKIKAWVIPTNEELMIARDTKNLVK